MAVNPDHVHLFIKYLPKYETFYYFLIITYYYLCISQTIYHVLAFPELIKKSLSLDKRRSKSQISWKNGTRLYTMYDRLLDFSNAPLLRKSK